jgi:hypothetical protein
MTHMNEPFRCPSIHRRLESFSSRRNTGAEFWGCERKTVGAVTTTCPERNLPFLADRADGGRE